MAACRGKTALVTNATYAPGSTAAISLADAGAQVLIHEERSSTHAEAIVEEAREITGTTLHPKLRAGTGIARAAASAASRDGAR